MEPISRQERLLPCWQHPIPNAALRQPYGAGVFSFPAAGRFYMRFSYTGSTKGPWRSAYSPQKLFVVS